MTRYNVTVKRKRAPEIRGCTLLVGSLVNSSHFGAKVLLPVGPRLLPRQNNSPNGRRSRWSTRASPCTYQSNKSHAHRRCMFGGLFIMLVVVVCAPHSFDNWIPLRPTPTRPTPHEESPLFCSLKMKFASFVIFSAVSVAAASRQLQDTCAPAGERSQQ